MPRDFAFEEYVKKCSYTDFLCRQDADPQGEWERQREMKREQSITTSEIEKEINAVAQQAKAEDPLPEGGTKAKRYSDSPEILTSPRSPKMENRTRKFTDPDKGFQSFNSYEFDPTYLEYRPRSDSEEEPFSSQRASSPGSALQRASSPGSTPQRSSSPGSTPQPQRASPPGYAPQRASSPGSTPQRASSSGSSSPRSATHRTVSPRSLSPSVVSPRTASPSAASSRPGTPSRSVTPQYTYSSQPRSSPVTKDMSNPSSIRGDDLNNDEYSRVTTPASIPTSHASRPTSKYRGVVIVLDKFNCMKLVESDSQLQDYLNDLPEEDFPKPPEISRALDHIQKMPVQRIHHYITVAEYIKHLQDTDTLCDVEIIVEPEKFPAHRAALACFSGYFSNLFFKRSQKVPFTFRMKNCSAVAFKVFLDFVYTGEMGVDSDHVADLVALADFLDIPAIKERCIWYLENMPLDKAIDSIKGKHLSSSNSVFQFALTRISEEFTRVYQIESFFELDVVTICLILSQHDLYITSEMDVFRVALRWITYKTKERQRYVNRVMKCVRYPHMRQVELLELLEVTDLLRESQEITNIILHANWVITTQMMERDDPLNCPVVRPRSCFSPKTLKKRNSVFFSAHSIDHEGDHTQDGESGLAVRPDNILATGGFQKFAKASDNRTVTMVGHYHTGKNRWIDHSNLPEPRFHHSMAQLKGKVYLVGGSDPKKGKKISVATNETFMYSADDGQWTQVEPMHTPRMYHKVVALYGMLYAIGGEDGNGRLLNTVECYNPMTNKWFFVKSMSTSRLGAGVAVLDEKIVVVGGIGKPSKNNAGLPVLVSVEVFDPKSNSWAPGSDLRFPRCHGNLVNVQGVLYLCGGATKSFATDDSVLTSVSSIDVYDKKNDVWEQKSNLVMARHFSGSAVSGGKIYIMGGVSTVANRTLSSIECYDAVNDVWVNGVQDLPYAARWLSCLSIPAKK